MIDLLTPLRVNDLVLENRIIMPPMARGLCTPDGKPTNALIQHYAHRAKGLGLLIVEHSYVTHEGKLSEGQLGVYNDSLIPHLKRITDAVHSKGTPVALQINHAGGKANEQLIGKQPVAPSPSDYFTEGETPRALTLEEVETIIKEFVDAARRAVDAGFDAVEVHGAHEFLLSQFVSPLTNTRKDTYGGSLENRMRFPLQVVESVNDYIGDVPLLYRLGATDRRPDGFTIDEARIFAKKLEEAGVNIIDVSGGLCGSRPSDLAGTQGFFVPLAEKIKKAVQVPVIGVGGIKDPKVADRFIRRNQVDLIAVGRALLRDPDWARNAIDVLSQ